MRNYITHLLVTASLLFVTYAAEAKTPPPGTGTANTRANILLAIDVSGSMAEMVPSGDNRYPVDVAFGPDGSVYIAKYYDTVEKFDADGDFVAEWGGQGDDNGEFDHTFGIDTDSHGNVYVTDYDNGRVQKFDSSGVYISQMDLTTSRARGIALDSSDNVYVLNGNGTVEKFNTSGVRVATWSNTGAYHIAIDSSDNVYIAKNSTQRVERYNTSGALQSTFTTFSSGSTKFSPYGIETDNSGNIYVSDKDNHKVYKYNSSGTKLATYGSSSGSSSSRYNSPRGIAVRPSSDIAYTADYQNHRIKGTDGSIFLVSEEPLTKLETTQRVIKSIVSDSDLTASANFGLLKWSNSATMLVPVSSTGAQEIYDTIDSLTASGGTYLDSGMTLAQNYYLGATSPRVATATCQKNIVIVLSDGEWVDTTASSTAQNLNDNYNVKTYVVGFLVGGSENYNTLSEAGGTYPDSPLFANNWQELYQVLSNYIQQASVANLTFTAPTIIPGVTNGDFIIQSTFTYKRDYQWKGRLKKYSLDESGNIGTELWDAGTVLNNTLANSRHLWTVGDGIPHSLNNFTTTYREELQIGLEENSGSSLSDAELDSLINFVRGKDSYDEFANDEDDEGEVLLAGERWKLGDIYHSRAVILGPPSTLASDEGTANSDAYYRYVNGYKDFKTSSECGGACNERKEVILAGSNGGMLHAFDSETGSELWGFIPPSVLPNFKNVISSDANKSVSIFGVDGAATIKDIYYDGEWHTVLVGGLRQGGHSYYALDLTDVESPAHLFTFAYNKLTNVISYWDEDGDRTNYEVGVDAIPDEYDYSDLGEAWSDPVILRIPVGGESKWVAVVAGGYNSATNPNYGANLFVLDLENGGQVLQKIDLADTNGGNSIVNAVPPRITAITANTTNLVTGAGALVYVTDLEGKLWKINLTDSGTLYDATRVFDAGATAANDRYAFHEMASSINDDGRLVHFFGTGNVMDLERVGADIQNRVYGIHDVNFPTYTSVSPFTVSSLQDAALSCPVESQQGWYFNLSTNEKVSAPISVSSNVLFIPRFMPDPADICSGGTSTLSERDYQCGSSISDNDLGSGIVTQAIVYKGKLYMGISNDAAAGEGELPDGYQKVGNLIVGTPTIDPETEVEIEYWWEVF